MIKNIILLKNMPEAVEVFIMSQELKPYIGKVIKFIKGKKFLNDSFIESFPMKLTDILVVGKKIILEFDNTWYFVTSLGLTGHFVQEKDVNSGWIRFNEKYFVVDFGDLFHFSDVMGYAHVLITKDKTMLDKVINEIGPNIFLDKIPKTYIQQLMDKKSKMNITKFLLDQKLISGIGNMYKCEGLYEAGICPLAKVGDLNINEMENLMKKIYEIMTKSYEKQMSGKEYDFKVYEQKIDKKGNKVETMKTADGRTTYYVNVLQRIGCD